MASGNKSSQGLRFRVRRPIRSLDSSGPRGVENLAPLADWPRPRRSWTNAEEPYLRLAHALRTLLQVL